MCVCVQETWVKQYTFVTLCVQWTELRNDCRQGFVTLAVCVCVGAYMCSLWSSTAGCHWPGVKLNDVSVCYECVREGEIV